ncbi:hypothetical protein [Streptomyces sp. KHY 26]|uniref:hypothetical protein n=1 Tax=Streptomyces sp. KHY 26 TaxID=3097359 RepID=UPI00376EA6BD
MTILRAASFGMPAHTRYTAQNGHIAVRPWLTSRRTPGRRALSLRLKITGVERARPGSVPSSALFRVTGPVPRFLTA